MAPVPGCYTGCSLSTSTSGSSTPCIRWHDGAAAARLGPSLQESAGSVLLPPGTDGTSSTSSTRKLLRRPIRGEETAEQDPQVPVSL